MNMAFLLRRASRKAAAMSYLRLWPMAYRRFLASLPAIRGPALVVGSAPEAAHPAGLDESWFRISVNGSQGTLDRFGLPPPQLTVFRSQLAGLKPDAAAVAAWQALAGRSTGHLVTGAEGRATAARTAAQHGYRAAHIIQVRNGLRGALIADLLGEYLTVGTNEMGISNGILAALLAARLGASPVVMSGFSLSGGWSYAPQLEGKRFHQEGDSRACRLMRDKGLPVFAADAGFAAATGLPLWRGSGHAGPKA